MVGIFIFLSCFLFYVSIIKMIRKICCSIRYNFNKLEKLVDWSGGWRLQRNQRDSRDPAGAQRRGGLALARRKALARNGNQRFL